MLCFSRLCVFFFLSLGIVVWSGCPKQEQVKTTTLPTQKENKNLLPSIVSALQGKPASDFSLQNIEGETVALSQFKGKVILVNFWATWCGPCKKELVYFDRFYQKYKAQGLEVLAISTDTGNTVAQVTPTVRRYGYQFKVLLDTEGKVNNVYNPKNSTPFSALVDRRGRIRYEHPGYTPGDEKTLEIYIQQLLKEAK